MANVAQADGVEDSIVKSRMTAAGTKIIRVRIREMGNKVPDCEDEEVAPFIRAISAKNLERNSFWP